MHSLKLHHDPSKRKIVVAMSGGVDSSVVAALLKYHGYEVHGVTLRLFGEKNDLYGAEANCSGQDLTDAKRIAEFLGIPHTIVDVRSRFREQVVDHFADSYLAGETPNPCVQCNRSFKFHDLLKFSQEIGADGLATGHYVSCKPLQEGYGLYRAADAMRDQSYFLYSITHEQLSRLVFPLGEAVNKAQTRSIARQFDLPIAEKPDSQDICFIPKGRYSDIIRNIRPSSIKEGSIVHIDGRELGTHSGIINYTVGQRKGLGISAEEPLYVIRLDAEHARVVVGPKESLMTRQIYVDQLNWLSLKKPQYSCSDKEQTMRISARVRSTRPPKPGILTLRENGKAIIELDEPEIGVSPGQACVFYDSDDQRARVLGGGTIIKYDKINTLL